MACTIAVLTVPQLQDVTVMLYIPTGTSAAEENSGIVGNEPSASNVCNGGKQSHHRATHAGQILGCRVSSDVPLQLKSSQAPAVLLSVADAAADTPPSTWQQVTLIHNALCTV